MVVGELTIIIARFIAPLKASLGNKILIFKDLNHLDPIPTNPLIHFTSMSAFVVYNRRRRPTWIIHGPKGLTDAFPAWLPFTVHEGPLALLCRSNLFNHHKYDHIQIQTRVRDIRDEQLSPCQTSLGSMDQC